MLTFPDNFVVIDMLLMLIQSRYNHPLKESSFLNTYASPISCIRTGLSECMLWHPDSRSAISSDDSKRIPPHVDIELEFEFRPLQLLFSCSRFMSSASFNIPRNSST